MRKAKFNENHKKILDSILLNIPIVTPGKMFGYPAYYVGGKLFACVYENAVGIKVPEDFAKEMLKKDEIVHFQPLGRKKMREWIQINRSNSKDYLDYKNIYDESIKYITSIAKKTRKK